MANTYTGTIAKNGTTIASDATVIITKIENKRIAIRSTYFDVYEVNVGKKRYFNSKTYYSTDEDEYLEVHKDGRLFVGHTDADGNSFQFDGLSH